MAVWPRFHWTMPPAVRDSSASLSPSRMPMFQRPTVKEAPPAGAVSATSGREWIVCPTDTTYPASHQGVSEARTSAASKTISRCVSARRSLGQPTATAFSSPGTATASYVSSHATSPSARTRARIHRSEAGAGSATADTAIPSELGVSVTGE